MTANSSFITIKGNRDGLTLYVDDSCSFEQVLQQLDETLSSDFADEESPMISIHLHMGNRYLHSEQEEALREIIRKKNKLVVQSIKSNVISREKALAWKEDSEVKIINKVIRSGQLVEVTGDLLLVGDVNPGGEVVATGNIFVMGNLLGMAHAGVHGYKEAVIAASCMKPTQLRIADLISRSPDYEADSLYMECAFVEKEKIMIDRLQVLAQKRPDISGFERRMIYG